MRTLIVMTKTAVGSDEDLNGVNLGPKTYWAGEQVEVSQSLARNFVLLGVAEPISEMTPSVSEESAPEPVRARKDLGAAPENKASKGARRKKGS